MPKPGVVSFVKNYHPTSIVNSNCKVLFIVVDDIYYWDTVVMRCCKKEHNQKGNDQGKFYVKPAEIETT